MKKFSFALTDELHHQLRKTAKVYDTSMSAICREALTAHLHHLKDPFEQSIEEVLASIPDPDQEISSWDRLKSQVWDFLNRPDDLLSPDCGFFSEEYIPEIPGFENDLFAHLPAVYPPTHGKSSRPKKVTRSIWDEGTFDHNRFLDEIWA